MRTKSLARLGLIKLCALGAVVAAGRSASAQLVFTGSSGNLAGQATFSIVGTSLQVQLTNTSASDVLVPADVLTAVFFDISLSAPTLTPSQAILDPGSSVYYDPQGQPAGGIVGGEWAYKAGIGADAPGGRSYGISSAGFTIFGPGDRFPGPDLAPPPSPDGVEYGLLSAGDDVGTGNSGVTDSGGMIKNSVTFTLDGAGADFDLSRIHNVFFQYGTTLGSEPGYGASTPAPGAAAVFAMSGVLAARRRRV